MAGDWIPVSVDLLSKPEVARLSFALKCSIEHVCGMLLRFWIWAQTHTSDGHLPDLDIRTASAASQVPEEFLAQLQDVGWLEVTTNGLNVPNFERWFSKAAKRRLQDAARKREARPPKMPSAKCPQNVRNDADKMRTREEKRREEKIYNIPPNGGSRLDSRPPSVEVGQRSRSETEKPQIRDSPPLAQAIKQLTAAWNALEGIPAIRSWSDARRRALKARLRDPAWLEQALEAIRRIPKSPFLCGQNERGWRANIDWLLRPDSVTRVLEGAYEGQPKSSWEIPNPFENPGGKAGQ